MNKKNSLGRLCKTRVRNNMKQVFFILMTAFVLCSCGQLPQDSNAEMADKQEKMMKEATSQIGMPAITNFQEKKIAKMIFELRDREDLICYAYIVNQLSGKLVFLGKCMGYGLPYSTQYTNPMKTVDSFQAHGYCEQLPQADPNGLFMPEGLSATWLMMIDPETGEPRPVYLEPEIIVSPFKLDVL